MSILADGLKGILTRDTHKEYAPRMNPHVLHMTPEYIFMVQKS